MIQQSSARRLNENHVTQSPHLHCRAWIHHRHWSPHRADGRATLCDGSQHLNVFRLGIKLLSDVIARAAGVEDATAEGVGASAGARNNETHDRVAVILATSTTAGVIPGNAVAAPAGNEGPVLSSMHVVEAIRMVLCILS